KEVFDSTGQGIIVTDPEGVIVSVNPMFTTLTGYEEKEAIGKRPNILSSGEHGKEFYEALWADIQKKGSWHGEIWNQRKNRETYLQFLSIDSVRDVAEDTFRYIGTANDVPHVVEMKVERGRRIVHFTETRIASVGMNFSAMMVNVEGGCVVRQAIPVKDAVQLVTGHARPIENETVQLQEAYGHILAEPIIAKHDVPPFNRSAYDGFAVRATDTINAKAGEAVSFHVIGNIGAGEVGERELKENEAYRIMTGAILPKGADAIVMLEDTTETKQGFSMEKSFQP